MKLSVFLISLIIICILPLIFSQSSKPLPGCSACSYYASIEEDCQQPNVPVDQLPQDCSSFIYFDIRPDASFNIEFGNPNVSNDEYLNSLLGSGKSTFLYYNRIMFEDEWLPALQNGAENAVTEMANLKAFLEPYSSISGLILGGLNPAAGTNDTDCISENLRAYLNKMRDCLPNYSIGIDIYGRLLSAFYAVPNPTPYLNYSLLDPLIDFYVINVFPLNDCTEEYQVGGEIPVNGTAPYTIDNVRCCVTQLGIQKKKMYFFYRVGPETLVTSNDSACDRTLAKVCASPTLDGYCSDTTQTYYDKGAYAKQYGVGFIASGVDLRDDPYGCCQCGAPYPAFYDILAGFNGEPVPPACPLLDKS